MQQATKSEHSGLIGAIQKQITSLQEHQEKNAKEVMKVSLNMDNLRKDIQPMIRVYAIFDGTGTLMKWIFTWLIIPISVIIGIILSWGRIIRK